MASKTILLVEDSESDHFLFQAMTEMYSSDIAIQQAYDGKQGLEILTQADSLPDIIFLDINMPRMNGHEFLSVGHDFIEKNNIKVVVLSSSTWKEDIEQAMDYDCVKGFLEKPIKTAILHEYLSN